MESMFRLVKSTTLPLTAELAEKHRTMAASPTERALDPARVKMLKERAAAGQLTSFNWAIAKFGDQLFRMNGQHSATMLGDLNGGFPKDNFVHLDEYEVRSKDGLAVLFRQFDNRKSGRTPTDVSGAYQGLYDDLAGVNRAAAKLAVEGVAFFQKHVIGKPAPTGDDIYTLFGDIDLHAFIKWLGDLMSIKTPELKRVPIIAAMYGTYDINADAADKFWQLVARGGVEFEDNHPTTVLDGFYKAVAENKKRLDLKPAQYYQAAIFAWNAYRGEKTINQVKHDTTKGFLDIAH